MQTLQRRRCQTRTRPRKKACAYGFGVSGGMLGEYDANQNPIYETIYLDDTPVGVLKQTGTKASANISTSIYNVYADHLDTPRVITRNSDEAIVWRWDSAEAFGATAPNQNPNGLGVFMFNQRFPGQIYDIETGLFDNGFRTYDPRSGGRYRQSDPIGLRGGINTYAYTGSNPLSFTDSKGLSAAIALPALPALPSLAPAVDAAVALCMANPLTCAAGVGVGIGTLINPIVQPAIANVVDACTKDKNCEALRDSILDTCASLRGKKQRACFAAAESAYRQCLGQK